ncbi:mannose-6-phosphate isomerase-like protein (cupin superfamily) [Salirhabdus euzebyi]|uniref:Mannose-6-phosphate isomerase-like protein (Cupin superfamily) n=1 Tax=Salirhabdus euzebyi TaxID=394506 RepID=A0A841Q7P4_9BACI|nr:hypothetical protein [Salirhabdus euzebyi]MBB6454599.1 mannose-6-phosphate isomerase-like protein (cupin superfamily) [Salirhabdus euzebyi]
MKYVSRSNIKPNPLPGRVIQSAVGKNSAVDSNKMSVGFANYSEQSGPMEPHHHAEETVYIIESNKGYVRYGDAKDNLGERIPLEAGMLLHFPELEWHVFEYDEGGSVDIMFIYGQVENIRPEEITSN